LRSWLVFSEYIVYKFHYPLQFFTLTPQKNLNRKAARMSSDLFLSRIPKLIHLAWPERQSHPCILIAPVIDGKPTSLRNRRVLVFHPDRRSIETGDVSAVKAGRGDVQDIQSLGQVTVHIDESMGLVEKWVEEMFHDSNNENSMDEVFDHIKKRIVAWEPFEGKRAVQVELFRAVVVNRNKNRIFVFKQPRSVYL
jgi:hypothetical protein